MKKSIPAKENVGIRGEIRIIEYRAGTHAKLAPYVAFYNKCKSLGYTETAKRAKQFIDMLYLAHRTDRMVTVNRNIIMQDVNIGKDLIVQRLLGVNTFSLNLSYGEIGTGTTTPTINDTALTTPTARASLSNGTAQNLGNKQAQIQYFFPDNTLANTTYYEFGTFVDGSASIGSGQLFNHSLFSTPYTKAPGTDITIQVNITIT